MGMEEERAHLPSVLGSAVRGHSLTGCLTLRCCRACPSGELLRESERLEMYLDLPWRWVKGEEGLALGAAEALRPVRRLWPLGVGGRFSGDAPGFGFDICHWQE